MLPEEWKNMCISFNYCNELELLTFFLDVEKVHNYNFIPGTYLGKKSWLLKKLLQNMQTCIFIESLGFGSEIPNRCNQKKYKNNGNEKINCDSQHLFTTR